MQDFWTREPQRSMAPVSIRSPNDYDGGEALAISCIQTELPAREQRRLVERWCSELPGLSRVCWLWFHSRVPQELFEAVRRAGISEARQLRQRGQHRAAGPDDAASVAAGR
jgi:hypothetical protein